MRDAAIHVADVEVDHQTGNGSVRALKGITLRVPAGTSVAVVGPSGCGKSTLLGLVGGLALPTRGVVRIGPLEVSGMTERQRADYRRVHLGFVYQADNLLPFLTVAENIQLQFALCGGQGSAPDGVMDLLVDLGLRAKADALPDQLSGGQRQRVAVARAVVHRPTLILADEPTGALDVANAATVIDLLLRVRRAMHATLLMVTHDAGAARRMDRVIAMDNGALVGDTGSH